MTTLNLALTGGIACGKSQMAQIFAQLGADVIQLDHIARQVTIPKSKELNALVDAFGKKILNQNGSLNRKALRVILLSNAHNKHRIESILHPKILAIMQQWQKNSTKSLTIVEIPLLAEKNLVALFDRVIVLTCTQKNQLNRLTSRENINKEQAKKMIAVQTSHHNRLKIIGKTPCDVIENNGTLTDLKKQTEQLYQKINLLSIG